MERLRRRRSKRQMDPAAVLTADLLLLTTSWLTSKEATCFRATSQTSCRLVIRNIPVSTADFAYCEAVTRPGVAYLYSMHLQEPPHLNRFSPLRCWQFRWADVDLRLAPRRLLRDKGFVLALVSHNGDALYYADASLKSDKDVVLAAVKKSGCALHYANASFRRDKNIVLAAAAQNLNALLYAFF